MPQQTAGLAKRLAEAADGFRDGKYYYFVSKATYDFDLQYAGADTDEEAYALASEIKQNKGDDYEIYGPYKTQESPMSPVETWSSVQLILTKQNSDPVTYTLGNDTDAIILSLSAYDKFFLPYYTRLYGSVVANNLRNDAAQALVAQSYVPGTHGNVTALKFSLFNQSNQSSVQS